MPLSHCDTWTVERHGPIQGRVPDCLGGLSRVGISSRSTRPWNGQPPSVYTMLGPATKLRRSVEMTIWQLVRLAIFDNELWTDYNNNNKITMYFFSLPIYSDASL